VQSRSECATFAEGVPHFFPAATAAARHDGSRGGEKMLVSCRDDVFTTEGRQWRTKTGSCGRADGRTEASLLRQGDQRQLGGVCCVGLREPAAVALRRRQFKTLHALLPPADGCCRLATMSPSAPYAMIPDLVRWIGRPHADRRLPALPTARSDHTWGIHKGDRLPSLRDARPLLGEADDPWLPVRRAST